MVIYSSKLAKKNFVELNKFNDGHVKIYTHIDLFTSENNKSNKSIIGLKINPLETQTFSKIFLFHSKTFCS